MSQTPADDRFCPTDGQLLSQFLAQRSQEAFAALVRRHTGMVLRVCRARAGADAEQACFSPLPSQGRSLTGAATVAGWLYRVAWYIAGRSAEAAAIRRRHEQEAARMRSEQIHPDSSAVPEAALLAALAALPGKHRFTGAHWPETKHFCAKSRRRRKASTSSGVDVHAPLTRVVCGRVDADDLVSIAPSIGADSTRP
jgi:hypothetical protein